MLEELIAQLEAHLAEEKNTTILGSHCSLLATNGTTRAGKRVLAKPLSGSRSTPQK